MQLVEEPLPPLEYTVPERKPKPEPEVEEVVAVEIKPEAEVSSVEETGSIAAAVATTDIKNDSHPTTSEPKPEAEKTSESQSHETTKDQPAPADDNQDDFGAGIV